MSTNRYVTCLKNAMFDNYGYFARNLRYVINVTHRILRYGASRLFINPPYSPGVWQKKNPSSSLQPRCLLLVQRREERKRRTSL